MKSLRDSRLIVARHSEARRGLARLGAVWLGRHGPARHGAEWQGKAWHGPLSVADHDGLRPDSGNHVACAAEAKVAEKTAFEDHA